MSYDEISRKPYKAKCACGHGFIRYYRVVESNDWGTERESNTAAEIHCDQCKTHYHCERYDYDYYLVPNGLSFPRMMYPLDRKKDYNDAEIFIQKYDKAVIEEMLADMTAPKHRFIKDLTYRPAIEYASMWAFRFKRKSLEPMIDYLRAIHSSYDEIEKSCEKKKPYVDEYNRKKQEREQEALFVEQSSYRLSFEYDEQQAEYDSEQERIKQKEYYEAHRYDDFQATVSYHPSYRSDLTGRYWDSLLIKECVDPEYLLLNKSRYGNSNITIVKKYRCICSICKKEIIVDSSDFEV